MSIRIVLLAALTSVFLVACGDSQDDEAVVERPVITGTISYRERIALSENASVEIELLDVSRQDVEATVIARQRIEQPGQVPIEFELSFDPELIDERNAYAVSARIKQGRTLLFINDTNTPVLTRGAGREVDLLLSQVRQPGFGRMMPYKPRKKTPEQIGSGFEMTGMFRYLADAARFRDCHGNRSLPVAMEGQYAELESAYLSSGVEPGQEVLVAIVGRRMERPAMEGNHMEVNVIVDIFNNIYPDKTCTPVTKATLTDTYWKLTEVGDRAVTTPRDMNEAHLLLDGAESRARGNAGCNRFFGQFEAGEAEIAFSALGSTMMACPETMDTERAFLAALGAAAAFRIEGEVLELLDAADGKVLARFESVYF